MGVTVYTIGFGLKDKASAFLAGGEYKTWNWNYGWINYYFPGIASSGCAKTAMMQIVFLIFLTRFQKLSQITLRLQGKNCRCH